MNSIDLAKNIIGKSQNILIFSSPESHGDGLGSGLALFYTLKKIGKNVNIDIGNVPEKFKFLTDNDDISSPASNFTISINTEGKEISRMRYEKNGKDLKIHLALSKGAVSVGDISFAPPPFGQNPLLPQPDLLIAIGAQSLENIDRNFWNLPILNIGNEPQNENFGEVNLIEMTCSLSEITTRLVRSLIAQELLDEKTATCLLSGIIWFSQNFRNPKTRPKTFETSAFLIESGANHQKIIQYLYRQKNIAQIKLLGKILENLNLYEPKDVYSASLKEDDFRACGASSKDLAFVMEELKFHFRHLPNLLVLWESHASPPLIKGIFYSPNSLFTEKILENFEAVSKNNGALFLIREADLNVARKKVLNIL